MGARVSLDALLEPTKEQVLSIKKQLDEAKIANQPMALCHASGEAFHNISPFTLRDLRRYDANKLIEKIGESKTVILSKRNRKNSDIMINIYTKKGI